MVEEEKPKVELEEVPKKSKQKMASRPGKKKGLIRRVANRMNLIKDTPKNKKNYDNITSVKVKDNKKKDYKDEYENQLGRDIETEVGMLLNGQPYDPEVSLKPGKLRFVVNAKRADGKVEPHKKDFDLDYLFKKDKARLFFVRNSQYVDSFEVEKEEEDVELWVAVFDENNHGINGLSIVLKTGGKEYTSNNSYGGAENTPGYVRFNIPDLDYGKHKVVATLVNNPLYEADSKEVEIIIKEKFNIEFITVQNGGEVKGNSEIGLEWEVSDKKQVKYYELLLTTDDNVLNKKTISGKITQNTWTVPDIDAENCKFRIDAFYKNKDKLGYAESDEPFKISKEIKKLRAEFNKDIEVDEGEDVEVDIKVIDEKTNKPKRGVTVIVNCNGSGVSDNTGIKGIAKIRLTDLPVGVHEFTVGLEHRDYVAEEYEGKINIKAKPVSVRIKKGYPTRPLTVGGMSSLSWIIEGDNYDSVFLVITKSREIIQKFSFEKGQTFFEKWQLPDEEGDYILKITLVKDGKHAGVGDQKQFTLEEGLEVHFRQGYKPTGVLKPLQQKPIKWIVNGKGRYKEIVLELEKEGSRELDTTPFKKGIDMWEDWRAPAEPGNYILKVFLLDGDVQVGRGDNTTFTIEEGKGPLPPGGNGGITINIVNITNINSLYQGKEHLTILLNQLLQKITILIETNKRNPMPDQIVELLQNINTTILSVLQLLNKTNLNLNAINKQLNNIQILLQQLINQGSNILMINNMISIINNIVNEINIKIKENEEKKEKKLLTPVRNFFKTMKGKSEITYVLEFPGHSGNITRKMNELRKILESIDQTKFSKTKKQQIQKSLNFAETHYKEFINNRSYFNAIRDKFQQIDSRLVTDTIIEKLMDYNLLKQEFTNRDWTNSAITEFIKELNSYLYEKGYKKRDMDRLRKIVHKAKRDATGVLGAIRATSKILKRN